MPQYGKGLEPDLLNEMHEQIRVALVYGKPQMQASLRALRCQGNRMRGEGGKQRQGEKKTSIQHPLPDNALCIDMIQHSIFPSTLSWKMHEKSSCSANSSKENLALADRDVYGVDASRIRLRIGEILISTAMEAYANKIP